MALMAHLFSAAPRPAALTVPLGFATGGSAAAIAVLISRAMQSEACSSSIALWFFAAATAQMGLCIMSEIELIAPTQKIIRICACRWGSDYCPRHNCVCKRSGSNRC
jgi:putative pyoverdin transport system ATP-binding/permease protein